MCLLCASYFQPHFICLLPQKSDHLVVFSNFFSLPRIIDLEIVSSTLNLLYTISMVS